MSEQERLQALNNNDSMDFWGLDQPRCPHCGETYCISTNGTWRLYEEGEHTVTCDHCDLDFTVSTRVTYSFSTDCQEE